MKLCSVVLSAQLACAAAYRLDRTVCTTPIKTSTPRATHAEAIAPPSSPPLPQPLPRLAVALTREAGKNAPLDARLRQRGVSTVELPTLCFTPLDHARLAERLLAASSRASWVVVTSADAANLLAHEWDRAQRPPLTVACVGKATADALAAHGIAADFVPSKATAKVLAAELPADGPTSVLYPCSALAADTLCEALESRGFTTERLEVYTVEPAPWDAAEEELARATRVVTFASPSAARVWCERVGTAAGAVCIGETSGREAERLGFARVVYPDSPGIDAWADAVEAFCSRAEAAGPS